MRGAAARDGQRINNKTRKSSSNQRSSRLKLKPAAARGVDAVAISAFEIIATHPMIVLEMADHGFDGGAMAHLATDGFGDPADLAPDPDLEPVR
jgi:hypothetical protein